MGKNRQAITDHILKAYLNCKYKSYLKLHNHTGHRTDYEILQDRLDKEYRLAAQTKLKSHYLKDDVLHASPLTPAQLRLGKNVILDTVISGNGLQASYDALKKRSEGSKVASFSYEPVSFCRHKRISRIDKVLLAFKSVILTSLQGKMPDRGQLIYGGNFSRSTVRLAPHIKAVDGLIADLKNQISVSDDLSPFLNPHCDICEFSGFCKREAIDADHLSLLTGISEKEVSRHNRKGIFTVNQLSYTFRPRRPPKRAKNPSKPHYFALQALSLRENNIHIHGKPELPMSETRVYFDIEGVPERDFYYLIGTVIDTKGTTTHHYYWADQEIDQERIFCQFAESLQQLPNCSLFHYGSYDATALKRMKGRLPTRCQESLEATLEKTINVLSVIHPHIYFPTYSNNLKDIGLLLGCKWTDSNSSGIQSMIWREQWETDNAPLLKRRLVTYNKEDCLALKTVCEFVARVRSSDDPRVTDNRESTTIVNTDSLERRSKYKPVFGKAVFAVEDFEYVNRCAYFDYQREKIFARTNRQFRSINRRGGKVPPMSPKPTTVVYIKCTQCPYCGGKRISPRSERISSQVDLKYSKHGVKKWVPQYVSWRYECRKCRRKFTSRDWPESRRICGHGLACWCVYHNIARKQSMLQVSRALRDIFSIHPARDQLYRFKTSVAAYYNSTYENILHRIVKGPIIHADETPVKLKGANGYVWVFASMDRVYYFYRESREGSFLNHMLGEFEGVLISDFYSAYDSVDCPQQKCLIHLVRDINDDMFRNPFDTELKEMAQQFATLLRTIIETVDRYGLKRWHLHKHKKAVQRFLKNVCSQEFSSEVAEKYQKRFNKSGEKLFTFLDYDGVPWNNNNAEHAINWFAKYRRFADGSFTERSLKELLLILSVFQTCEYNNINVLKFLLSKEKDIPGMATSQTNY